MFTPVFELKNQKKQNLEYWRRVLVINRLMNVHSAQRISPAHRQQLQQKPGTIRPRQQAIKPHLHLGGVSSV